MNQIDRNCSNAQQNWHNRTVFTGDNLYVLRNMNCESVDLIYLDPPFNSNRWYCTPTTETAYGFKDIWHITDIDVLEHNRLARTNPQLYSMIKSAWAAHSKGMFSYVLMMAMRLLELHRVLKPTGSLYLHCDSTAVHYLRMILDSIFGAQNFRNDIIWAYKTGGTSKRWFARKHDTILFYTKSNRYCFHPLTEKSYVRTVPEPHTQSGKRLGVKRDPICDVCGIGSPSQKYRWVAMRDVWGDIGSLFRNSAERKHYPTQKPLDLLKRIICVSSNAGDVVLDPFCGCATTLIAAEALERQWVGIDISAHTADLVLKHTDNVHVRNDVPTRTNRVHPPYPTSAQDVYNLQKGHCNGCNAQFSLHNMEMDYIVPLSKGGAPHFDNCQMLCHVCKSTKGERSQAEFKDQLLIEKRIDISWLG